MQKFINTDFVSKKERLAQLGCRPVRFIKGYENKFKDLNNKKALVKKNIKVN